MKQNTSSYFPLKMLCRTAPTGIMFGPTEFKKERDWLYPNRILKLNSTIIWIPEKKVHIGLASYVDAQETQDEEALAKLAELKIPLGIKFTNDNDFSGTYEIDNNTRKESTERKPIVKVMRVKFGGHYDNGGAFKPGDIVKVTMKKWYDGEDRNGRKRWLNGYEHPTDEEMKLVR
jgi:hypothetical protein